MNKIGGFGQMGSHLGVVEKWAKKLACEICMPSHSGDGTVDNTHAFGV